MNKDEKRELRRKRLMDNKAYQTMNGLTRYMDRYYLDALIGIIPGWGDAIALLSVVPFIYFSSRVIKSIPLTLAILNNALRDVLMGMIPFFVGDVIDFFHCANIQNMQIRNLSLKCGERPRYKEFGMLHMGFAFFIDNSLFLNVTILHTEVSCLRAYWV